VVHLRRRGASPRPDPAAPGRRPRYSAWLLGASAEIQLTAVATVTLGILVRSATPAAYYLLIPTWAVVALLLLVIRRLAAMLPRPRLAMGVVVGAWATLHLAVLAVLLAPGSAVDQLMVASSQMRDIGAALRDVYAEGRPPGPIAWRTLASPATEFFVLRDPSQGHVGATGGYGVGGDLYPYLLGDPTWARRTTYLPDGTVDQIRALPAEAHRTIVVIDDGYRVVLVTYEGQVVMDATAGSAAQSASAGRSVGSR
jgi:hypothetical protein